MKVVCIIQARMGSTRLPGKVMLDLCGKTVLERVVERVRKVKNIDEIVIATTTKKDDDIIVNKALKCNVKIFRGSEDDVLSRYYFAAKKYNADVIVRITSDCPLIDPAVTESVIDYYLKNVYKFDYVSNTLERTYPRGLDTEVFSFKSLEKAFAEAILERDREHVTTYIWKNPDVFKLGCYKNDKDYSHLRWTLDTSEDYELIKRIYNYFCSFNNLNFRMIDVINLYKVDNELISINNMVKQKEI